MSLTRGQADSRLPAVAPDHLVAFARSIRPDYGALAEPRPAPELPGGQVRTVAQAAVRDLLRVWGLDAERVGERDWNPLGALIAPGARVVVKPNWVVHYNRSGAGLDCLVTHPSVIEAVMDYVALARPGAVVIGDAPVQGCDLARLWGELGMEDLADSCRGRGLTVELADFRRTVLDGQRLGDDRSENRRDVADYVRFDLAHESLLEAIAADSRRFRVTMYNPDLLRRTHAPGRHQYLVARQLIEADVVINLPKLKTHKKAGITGALKNLVGINGNKEFLPHHRKGGSLDGGDCYPGRSWFKRCAESLLDAANRSPSGIRQAWLGRLAEACLRGSRLCGSDANLEGSWYGNDTVWRTCLDLHRILLYGEQDGRLATTPRRRIVSITDAIIGGEGEGPLANTPVAAGFVTGSLNPAAAEWVHARLMGFDPRRIALVREAFGQFGYPLASFEPAAIRVLLPEGEAGAEDVGPWQGRPFRPAAGWAGHCEITPP